MKNKDYLFAVASLRARENELLTKSDFEQLISAESYEKAVSLLNDKGYEISGDDYSSRLDENLNEVWDYIIKSAPEAEILKAFVVKNDFHNIKAILKSEVMNYSAEDYMLSPSIVSPQDMIEAISARDFKKLPDYISAAAEDAAQILAKTQNAQLCDAVCDTAALEAMISLSEGGDEILKEYANIFCLSSNIKTAFRAIKTKKSSAFLNASIAKNSLIDKKEFISAALSGEDELSEFLILKGFEEFAAAFEESPSQFEKYCDDKMISIIKKSKMTVFGISPVAAYFLAKENEIKCLRIILSAKQSRISNDIIRERMREVYV
ncbi:MAG: V-type ATPase subunit [Eubacterium sp.]|nr:V-type ATPase subunit [Eubacterium sp.]